MPSFADRRSGVYARLGFLTCVAVLGRAPMGANKRRLSDSRLHSGIERPIVCTNKEENANMHRPPKESEVPRIRERSLETQQSNRWEFANDEDHARNWECHNWDALRGKCWNRT